MHPTLVEIALMSIPVVQACVWRGMREMAARLIKGREKSITRSLPSLLALNDVYRFWASVGRLDFCHSFLAQYYRHQITQSNTWTKFLTSLKQELKDHSFLAPLLLFRNWWKSVQQKIGQFAVRISFSVTVTFVNFFCHQSIQFPIEEGEGKKERLHENIFQVNS